MFPFIAKKRVSNVLSLLMICALLATVFVVVTQRPAVHWAHPSTLMILESVLDTHNITGPLNWQQFSDKVLSRACFYKGVFIQEATINWDTPLFQRPQQIALAFAKSQYLVIYKTYETLSYVDIAADLWLAPATETHLDRWPGAVHSFYSTAYAFQPSAFSAVRPYGPVVYEYIDHIDPDISGYGPETEKLRELQKAAFEGGVDYVVVSARKLYEHALASGVPADRIVMVPNGVDVNHYRSSRATELTESPSSLTQLRKFKQQFQGIVGYFGALAPWIWYDMLEQLVQLRPELGFVFIGPDYHGGVQRLPQTANVLYLGTIAYQLLPVYAGLFDIALIPFAPGPIAQTTSPLKLFEYFALEKPVVATSDMLECVAYPEVLHGANAVEFSFALTKALRQSKQPQHLLQLRRTADKNSWEARVAAFSVVFDSMERNCA